MWVEGDLLGVWLNVKIFKCVQDLYETRTFSYIDLVDS